jgi:hypothetical protein
MPKPQIVKQVTLPLADWAGSLQLPMLQVDNGDGYIPVKPLYQGLTGSQDDSGQRARINRDPILGQLATYLPVDTPGGSQEMLCLPWLGVGRYIDRLNLGSVLETYRSQVLNVMWAVTFAAYEVVTGQRVVPNLITIVPSDHILASVPDKDVRRMLIFLAERMGRMEIASRTVAEANADIHSTLRALVEGASAEESKCPCCGQAMPES